MSVTPLRAAARIPAGTEAGSRPTTKSARLAMGDPDSIYIKYV